MELNRKIFKAYDIRGVYPTEINEEAVSLIAKKLANCFSGQVVIGHDVRLSSPALFEQLKKGLSINKKLKILETGLVTTPMIYFLVNKLKLNGGVMITASHDPKEFNGMKIVGPKAKMISGEEIQEFLVSSF